MLNQPTLADDDVKLHLAPRPITALLGRILLSVIFVFGGVFKLTHLPETAGYMTSAGIPEASTLAVIAGLAEILGGIAILTGFLTRIGALGLFAYLIPVTLMLHPFWNASAAEQQMQLTQFMKNLAIMGGLLLLLAHGPAGYSVDAKLRKHRQV